ncbi:uncharacterized protein LOC134696239 [Mytilus trossulus]|uniref:uncharacterized protein LOC134696239 n=1 Tax=Mytilus trossulus TaxID=6551 RepID=UPI00300470A1
MEQNRNKLNSRSINYWLKILLLLFFTASIFILGMQNVNFPSTNFVLSFTSRSEYAFLVYTSACKIPKVDPFAPSVKKLLKPGTVLRCDPDVDIVYQKDNKLIINRTAVNESRRYKDLSYCKYKTIWRPIEKPTSHDYFRYINESEAFTSDIKLRIEDEFVKLNCYEKDDTTIYTNFFAFVQRKDQVEKRCNNIYQKHSKNRNERLSVMLLGVESVSQINMIRYMTETRKYLLQNMSAIELLGYNKLADNTFPNIVPMTTGKYLEELPWNETVKDVPLDKHDFMWNKYSREGYRTFYAEDAPKIAIFDYHKAGFERPATDYYNRHLSVAMEKEYELWNTDNNCIHARPETAFILDYLKQFMTVFKSNPYFAFTFISRLTHDRMERPAMADRLYKDFFKKLNKNNTLDNTVLFFFSDHGIRFGKVRETFIGKLEERLPFGFFIFPKWFYEKYPKLKRNLEINSRRLTTPFDIYATLMDILHFKSNRKEKIHKSRSTSLLDEIPESRTCNDVDMLPHWCSCADHEMLSTKVESAVQSAKQMILELNQQLNKTTVCETLYLNEIKLASKLILPNKVLTFKSSDWDVINRTVVFGKRIDSYVDYQLMLETKPGDALFEGTVRYNEKYKTYKLMGEVSRINMYGSQSHCVNDSHLKKICFCKKQT